MNPTIHNSFWSDADIEAVEPEIKLTVLWLNTNPQTTIIGLCQVSARRFTFETGLEPVWLEKACEKLPRLLLKTAEGIWVRRFITQQFGVGDRLLRNNCIRPIISALTAVKDADLRQALADDYPELASPSEGPSKPLLSPSEGPSKPLLSPSEGPSKPLLSPSEGPSKPLLRGRVEQSRVEQSSEKEEGPGETIVPALLATKTAGGEVRGSDELSREEIWKRVCGIVGRDPTKPQSRLEMENLDNVSGITEEDMRLVEQYAKLCRAEPAKYTKPKVLAHTLLEEFHAEVSKARQALRIPLPSTGTANVNSLPEDWKQFRNALTAKFPSSADRIAAWTNWDMAVHGMTTVRDDYRLWRKHGCPATLTS